MDTIRNAKYDDSGEMVSCMYLTKNNTWKFWTTESDDMSYLGRGWRDTYNSGK